MLSLDQIPLLSALSSKERKDFGEKCRWRDYDARQTVIGRGDTYSDVFFLIAGVARVIDFSITGKVIDYALLGEGDVFGELAAIDGLPRSASVVTQTPSTIASISGRDFVNFVTIRPQISLLLMQRLSSFIRRGDERIANFNLLGAEQRVCLELLRMAAPTAQDDGRKLVINPFPTQSAFSNGVGLARETVGRILSRLTREQLIERRQKALYLTNLEKLEERSLI